MDFKELLYLGLSAISGGILSILRSKSKLDVKKMAVKLLSAIMVGLILIPAAMQHFDFSFQFWIAFTAISSIVAEPIIEILTDKLQGKIKTQI